MRAARSPDRTQTTAGAIFSSAPDRTYSTPSWCEPDRRAERATDSAMCTSGLPYESHRRGEQIVAVDALAAGDRGRSSVRGIHVADQAGDKTSGVPSLLRPEEEWVRQVVASTVGAAVR